MTTTAKPVSAGSCSRRWVTADKPPAEAPTPTTGKADASCRAPVERPDDAALFLNGPALASDFAGLTIGAVQTISWQIWRPQKFHFSVSYPDSPAEVHR